MIKKDVSIIANGTTKVLTGTIDNTDEPCVIAARLLLANEIISRHMDWPQPFKYLDLSNRGVEVEFSSDDKVTVKATRPTKGLVFEETAGMHLSDNCIDIVPGDKQVIDVSGRDPKSQLRWTYLGSP